jgi:methyl coenzyme M reductase subunit C
VLTETVGKAMRFLSRVSRHEICPSSKLQKVFQRREGITAPRSGARDV